MASSCHSVLGERAHMREIVIITGGYEDDSRISLPVP